MVYLLYGKDTYRSRKNLKEILDSYRSKSGDSGLFQFEADNFDNEKVEELLKARSLFDNKYVVVFDGVLENKETESFILERLEKFSLSENIFFFLEKELGKKSLEEFEKNAKKIHHFSAPTPAIFKKWLMAEAEKLGVSKNKEQLEEIEKRHGGDMWQASQELEKLALGGVLQIKNEITYNVFSIADAIGEKNKRKAWVAVQKAALAGVPLQEVFWKMAWETKNLLLAKSLTEKGTKDLAKITGWHPYVAQKTATYCQNYSQEELANLSFKLVKAFQDWRMNEKEIQIILEKVLVS